MIKEKMLEYLMLAAILKDKFLSNENFENMYPRYKELQDEFINEYKPARPIIKNPVKDITATEE